jgi:murein DD-endopeptidase MepM/ murein hydrolase activator NlpD
MRLIDILKQYSVTSPYGPRKDPISGKSAFHSGIDLVGKEVNDPIEAFVEGDVIYAGNTYPGTGLGNYGWVVMVKDRNGKCHLYAHLQEKSLKVKVGDHVVQGQQLGIMGSTGRSTGKHLHYEIRTADKPQWGLGKHIDPMKYLITICQDGWKYYDRQGRKDMCDLMHETANYIRRMIGLKEE